MQGDPAAEWQRLTRFYEEKSDEELLELAEDFGNLTEVARQVLRDEMRKRKLEAPGTAPVADNSPAFGGSRAGGEQLIATEADASAGGASDDAVSRAYLCECEDEDQVNQLSEALRRAGVESWVESPHAQIPDSAFAVSRIFVRADQIAMARAVASRPIPPDIIDETTAPGEDFRAPVCPKCGAADPLLESVEPENTWRCEACGARWSDAAEVENAEP
jgi:hypothetical protein